MDQANDFQSDSPEESLERMGLPPRNAELRRTLLAATSRVVRRRRRLRQLSVGLAFACCYLAGIATAWSTLRGTNGFNFWRNQVAETRAEGTGGQPTVQVAASIDARREPVTDDADAATLHEAELIEEMGGGRGAPAELLERWAAGMSDAARAAMFRRAGDRYLEESGDLRSAVRCYSQSLDASSEDELAIPNDSDHWLIMAMKQARIKETHHADNDG